MLIKMFNISVTIIAHEFAHQWFGNLVTPEWWTYIWLNEGFATLYEHYATEWVLPEWKILDHFVYATLQNVFQNDARSETRPMSHYVENPDDIDMLFDSVAYDKSGSVLRMMLHALGETTFTKGLVYYLKAKEFSYASENDLFAALNQASREDNAISTSQSISLIMSSWTRQKGFPVVQVTRNYQTGTINLRQEKYLTVPSPDQDPALWWIPYNFATNNHSDFSNTKAENWIPGTRTATVNPTSSKTWESTDWIIFNKQETGYYRVLYDVQNYNLIINQLRDDFSKIHLTSRAQLIDDAFDFARTRRLDYGVAFDIAAHLERDIEYVPWGSFLRGLTLVNRMLVASSEYPRFQNFTRILIKHLYDNVGLTDKGDNEPHFQKQARIWAINWACTMNSEECLRDTALAMTQSVHVNVKQTIFCNGLRSASTSDYVNVFTLLTSATDPNDRNRFISALGCSRNRTHLMDYINTSDASSEENIYISQAERYRVFTSVLDNGQVGLQVAIEFLQNELAVAASAYGKNNINNALIAVATYITTTEMENEFLKVLGAAPGVNLIEPTTIVRAVQIIADNKAWLTAHKTSVENWVTEFHRSREDGENNNNGATTITLSALVIPFIMIIKLL